MSECLLEAPYQACLGAEKIKAQQRSQHGGNLNKHRSLINRCKQQDGDSPAWTELNSSYFHACVPLSWCCYREPPVGKGMKINLFYVSVICLCLFLPAYADSHGK